MGDQRKRITVKLKTPNPLFEKWLMEWRDKAKEENSKMQYCFSTALSSLRKYPLPFERGRDCKILKGFGDSICRMLDMKLKEYKKKPGNELNGVVIDLANKSKPVQDKTKQPDIICDENDEETPPKRGRQKQPSTDMQEKSKRRSSSKEYTPKEGSGGYAILITLYKKGMEPSYPGHLTKLELIRAAQHLTDTSFTKPDPGTRYTAWSSMRTLISKKLVKKVGSPAKFSLTDEGILLAKNLCDGLNKSTDLCNNKLNPSGHMVIDLSDEYETDKISPQHRDNSGSKSSAMSFKSSSEDNVTVSQPQNSKTIQRFDSSTSTTSSTMQKEIEELWNQEIMAEIQSSGTTSSVVTCSSVTSATSLFGSRSEENILVSRQKKSRTLLKYASSTSVASSTQSCTQEESVIFLPNSFDIILYVDTCETGGSNMDIQDDPLLAELKFLSVLYEVKKLKIGDYAWICRDKTTKNELVLPYIVERKRMDDFGASIKDGRYHEQKYRLKKSGIQNITYLVESYGKNKYVGLPITTLYQAATNTAVQDGFCIKFTENYKDTARYLANFSTLLTNEFKSKTLVSCPKENLSEQSLDDDLVSLMTFKEFNRSSSKNKPMKVSDLFVKMLVQLKGMSVDKALAIVGVYPTPECLRKAYEENPGIKGEKLLAQLHCGDRKKIVGLAPSKTIHQLFTMQSF